MAGDFSGLALDFVPGNVRGLRSWNVDSLGRLTGINYPKIWLPGDNEAVCLKNADVPGFYYSTTTGAAGIYTQAGQYISSGTIYPSAQVTWNPNTGAPTVYNKVTEPQDHKQKGVEAAQPKPKRHMEYCKCGFYAYYDGSNEYAQQGAVTGVIEGWGETLVGIRGFRAAKARIVAIHFQVYDPKRSDFKPVNSIMKKKVMHNYPNAAFFDDYEHMLDEFPPDGAVAEITPESDPEFWTKWAQR